jgi:hypothetical protein
VPRDSDQLSSVDDKPMDDRLVFAMIATSSSGNLAGEHREMKIEGAEAGAEGRRGRPA